MFCILFKNVMKETQAINCKYLTYLSTIQGKPFVNFVWRVSRDIKIKVFEIFQVWESLFRLKLEEILYPIAPDDNWCYDILRISYHAKFIESFSNSKFFLNTDKRKRPSLFPFIASYLKTLKNIFSANLDYFSKFKLKLLILWERFKTQESSWNLICLPFEALSNKWIKFNKRKIDYSNDKPLELSKTFCFRSFL